MCGKTTNKRKKSLERTRGKITYQHTPSPNPNCLDSRFCNPMHGEIGEVKYDMQKIFSYIRELEKKKGTLVYCPKKDCVHNKDRVCRRSIVHLKWQEPDPWALNGEFVCKDYRVKEDG